MLSTVAVRGYRSLRDLVLPLGPLTVITGANGSGKSSVYRSLRLLADCGRGEAIGSLAREGGLQSARWAGRLDKDRPVELQLGFASDDFGYTIDLGLPIPSRSMFDRDPHIKSETIFAGPVLRPATTLVQRAGPLVQAQNDSGRGFTEVARSVPSHRSILTEFANPRDMPELAAVRDRLRAWHFYDGFRVDADAPARQAQIGTRTTILADDGADLAAAIQTIIEAGDGSGAAELEQAVADAFDGAEISVRSTDGLFELQLHQPGITRPLRATELSDGTLRFLLWTAALLGPELPSLMVLNEPETSLHPALVGPLARLILAAAANTQVIVVTHSEVLLRQLESTSHRIEHIKEDGETQIKGQGILDAPSWHWGSR